MKVGHFGSYTGYLFLYENFFRTASLKLKKKTLKHAWKANFSYSENFSYDKIEKLSFNSICYVCP